MVMAIIPTAALLLATQLHESAGFTVFQTRPLRYTPSASVALNGRTSRTRAATTTLKGIFDDNDEAEDEIQIPPELRDEIFRAEANTPAAQGRQERIITYVLLTLAGVTIAIFNGFLTELRSGEGAPSSDLAYYGFGWVQDNFLAKFAFTTGIGGGIGLLGAGLTGTLAEMEIRSKKENAEKIFLEMQRRKSLKEKPTSRSGRKKKKRSLNKSSKKDMTGKQKKRLSALEELMEEEPEVQNVQQNNVEMSKGDVSVEKTEGAEKNESSDAEDGIFGSIKGFYKKADNMAASQALLLNKELEDRGVIDKITDESGLKVIGKEAASKLGENEKQSK